MAAAAILREALPSLDEPIVTYLDRYIYDAGEDPTVDVMEDVVRPMLSLLLFVSLLTHRND